jgi:hypothetical protein
MKTTVTNTTGQSDYMSTVRLFDSAARREGEKREGEGEREERREVHKCKVRCGELSVEAHNADSRPGPLTRRCAHAWPRCVQNTKTRYSPDAGRRCIHNGPSSWLAHHSSIATRYSYWPSSPTPSPSTSPSTSREQARVFRNLNSIRYYYDEGARMAA